MNNPLRLFLFELCLSLGVAHPDYLPLDSTQISEWQAYAELHPYGDKREDIRTATVVHMIYAMLTKERKLDFTDFVLPDLLKPSQPKRDVFAERMRAWRASTERR